MGALGWEWESAWSWLGQEVSQGTWEITLSSLFLWKSGGRTSKFAKNTQQGKEAALRFLSRLQGGGVCSPLIHSVE